VWAVWSKSRSVEASKQQQIRTNPPEIPTLLSAPANTISDQRLTEINQWLSKRNCAQAIPLLRDYLQTDTSSQGRLVLAQCLVQQGNGEEALILLQALAKNGMADSILSAWSQKATVLAREDDEMGRKQSAHFELWVEGKVKTWNASDTLLSALEVFYDRMCLAFNHYPTNKIPSVLYMSGRFQSRPLPDWTGALFDGKVRIPYNVLQDWPLHQKILAHEVAHAFVHDLAETSMDSWFDEGIAQHLDGTLWDAGKMPATEIATIANLSQNDFLEHADADDARRLYFTSLGMFEVLYKNCFRGDFTQIKPILLDLRSGNTLAQSLQSHCGLKVDDLWNNTRLLMDSATTTQGNYVPEFIDSRSSSSP
jgi:hypothetical protein